jgi:hypothetical protein
MAEKEGADEELKSLFILQASQHALSLYAPSVPGEAPTPDAPLSPLHGEGHLPVLGLFQTHRHAGVVTPTPIGDI